MSDTQVTVKACGPLVLSNGNELTYQCNKFLMYCNGKVLEASLCYTKSPNNWKEYSMLECCKCFLLGWAVNALHNSCNVLINEFNFPFGIYRLKTLIISVCVTIIRKLFGRMCHRLSHQWEKHPAVAEDPVASDAAKQIPTGQ